MGAGGIVQQHARVLLHAVMDPSVYDCLTSEERDQVEAIHIKPLLQRDQADVDFLKGLVAKYC